MSGALDGVRVLDASQMLAGPICAMRLGDLGADVLKIEPPHGEHNRHNGFGAVRVNGATPTFMGLNRNKRSVTLDLKQPSGLAPCWSWWQRRTCSCRTTAWAPPSAWASAGSSCRR